MPYRTDDNRIAGVVITFVDITARKHAEQAIEAAQARLHAVIEQMPTHSGCCVDECRSHLQRGG